MGDNVSFGCGHGGLVAVAYVVAVVDCVNCDGSDGWVVDRDFRVLELLEKWHEKVIFF